MNLTPDEHVLFNRAVWETFERRRGSEGPMSSAEFDLIWRWKARGIPLPVILRGIEECGGKGGKPKTLHYCAASVDQAFLYWQQAAGLTAEVADQWGPERAAEERARIMEKFGRRA